jgi:Thioesterase-like superfamily
VYRATALAGALLPVTLVLDAARLGGVGGQLTKQPICAAYGVSADGGSTVRGPTMPDKRPARWTVDLFRPTRVRPTTITTTVIRHGRRLGLIDAELLQEGQPVARSRALFAGPSETPEGQVWLPDRTFQAPPPDLLPHGDEQRLYYSDEVGWTAQPESHRNGSRKQTGHYPMRIVEAEEPTPFQMTASVGDVTSMVVNWGRAGLEFINTDINLALTRLPASMELGLSTIDRSENEGIAVGSAVVFDRKGPFGSVTVVAWANPVSLVDPGDRKPDLAAFAN